MTGFVAAAEPSRASRIPVTLLTGFLGSGKTTLLQRLLREEGGHNTAVLVNEIGEIGLDHLLVKAVAGVALVLQNGCICCTIRSDLRQAFRDLIDDRFRDGMPPIDRIVLETTGLADPLPIVQTLTTDPMLCRHIRLASIVTTVDALNSKEQVQEHEECRNQAAIADRIVLTKTDLVGSEKIAALRTEMRSLNPLATVCDPHAETLLWNVLFGSDGSDPETRGGETRRWLRCLPTPDADLGGVDRRHEETIQTFSVRLDRPVDWTVFGVWLSALVHRYGANILRVKGLLDVPNAKGPVVLDAVLRNVSPPFHLDDWPDLERGSRLVFIVKRLDPEAVKRSLENVLVQCTMDAYTPCIALAMPREMPGADMETDP